MKKKSFQISMVQISMKYIYCMAALIFFLLRCGNSSNKKSDDYNFNDYFNCPTKIPKPTKLTTYFSKSGSFKISLPDTWSVIQSGNDTASSIVGGDTILLKKGVVLVFSVTELPLSDSNLKNAFHTDLVGMSKDKSYRIIHKGKYNTTVNNGFWVETNQNIEGKQNLRSLMVYMMGSKKKKLYILQYTNSDTIEFKNQICTINSYVDTFQENI